MIFMSLMLDLLLMFGGPAVFATADDPVLVPAEHRTHGHLPGPPDGHNGDTHLHHGQHGHTLPISPAGGNHFHSP